MKKLNSLILLIGVLTALGGCSKEKSAATDDMPITVHSSIRTRVTDTNFQSGDKIGMTIVLPDDTKHANNSEMTHDGSSFKAEDLKWFAANLSATFQAYFPYQPTFPSDFTIKEDQTGEGYTESDILMARAVNVRPNANGVALEFQHVMAQVIVNIENESNLEVEKIIIGNTQSKVTLKHAEILAVIKGTSARIDIQARKLTPETFRAIIAPQSTQLHVTAKNSMDGETTVIFDANDFESGMSYRANITIGEDFDITTHDIEVLDEDEILGWGDGGDLTEEA